jgi:hypothetical protein
MRRNSARLQNEPLLAGVQQGLEDLPLEGRVALDNLFFHAAIVQVLFLGIYVGDHDSGV